jgi:hypothetical protein
MVPLYSSITEHRVVGGGTIFFGAVSHVTCGGMGGFPATAQ